MAEMCTCPNQLQPHDRLEGACPERKVFDIPAGMTADRISGWSPLYPVSEDDPAVGHTHPYLDELYLGGEG